MISSHIHNRIHSLREGRKGFSAPAFLAALVWFGVVGGFSLSTERLVAAESEAVAPSDPIGAVDKGESEAEATSAEVSSEQGIPTSEAPAPSADAAAAPGQPEAQEPVRRYIKEYRITGIKHLSTKEVEEAVYPYLGPGRTVEDVDKARAALQRAYQDKGYSNVTVEIPNQRMRRGIIRFKVVEMTVGRLRVRGARYFLPSEIKKGAPSLAEGKVVNVNDVNRDIMALNRFNDRQVTVVPALGREPGTLDVDLVVKDKFPLHGNLELNNRYSPNTTELRLNGGLSYTNLWQLGHRAGFDFQISPEDTSEVKVFSGFYTAPVPNVDWLSVSVVANKQDSDVSSLGTTTSVGRGESLGARLIFTLPTTSEFYQTFTFGLDYKKATQNTETFADLGITIDKRRVYYYPFSAEYTASWTGEKSETDLGATVTFHARGLGASSETFDRNRFDADASFVHLRGDLSRSQDVFGGVQLFGKVQGQVSDQPLVSNEQFTIGGLGTVRGYVEGEQVGDNGVAGTVEIRSPSLSWVLPKVVDEWRVYAFTDAGQAYVIKALPEQEDLFTLASFGIGTRVKVKDSFDGSLDVGYPLVGQPNTSRHVLRLTFTVGASF